MASSGKRPRASSPAAQRKSRKTNKVNLHASPNDEIIVVSTDASAAGLKQLQGLDQPSKIEVDLVFVEVSLPHRSGIERALQGEMYVNEEVK